MSISYLTSPNDFSLYSKRLTTGDLIADVLEAATQTVETLNATDANITGTGTLATLISNRLQTTDGYNYLGNYDPTKIYKFGDFVIYQWLFFRCLIDNTTGIAPDANNPAQTQWIQLSSYNAIFNDTLYLQVSGLSGSNDKAIFGPIPFSTVQNSLLFAADGARINLIDSAYTYNETLTLSDKDNITINGGLNGVYSAFGNTLSSTQTSGINISLARCNNITFKNVIFSNGSNATGTLMNLSDCTNIIFDSCVFNTPDSSTLSDIVITNEGGAQFFIGDVIFYNCRSKTTTSTQFLNISISSSNATIPTNSSRVFIINHLGPVGIKHNLNVSGQEKYFCYFVNCNNILANDVAFHNGYMSIKDSSISTDLVSPLGTTAVNNKLIITNTTLYNPVTGLYGFVNKSGTCPYLFQNFDYDKNRVTSLTGTATLPPYSFGPSKYFNQIASVQTVVGTTSLTGGTAVQLPFTTIGSNAYSIINIVNPNEISLVGSGYFTLFLNIELGTNQTANNCTSCNIWLGAVGSVEPGVSQTSCLLPYVSSAASYPTVRNNNIILSVSQAATTVYSIYFRNLGTVAFPVRLIGLMVLQMR